MERPEPVHLGRGPLLPTHHDTRHTLNTVSFREPARADRDFQRRLWRRRRWRNWRCQGQFALRMAISYPEDVDHRQIPPKSFDLERNRRSRTYLPEMREMLGKSMEWLIRRSIGSKVRWIRNLCRFGVLGISLCWLAAIAIVIDGFVDEDGTTDVGVVLGSRVYERWSPFSVSRGETGESARVLSRGPFSLNYCQRRHWKRGAR